jgi:hypothetical protein
MLLDLCHDEQFTERGEDAGCDDRIIGQIVIENYLDISRCPHPALIPANHTATDLQSA